MSDMNDDDIIFTSTMTVGALKYMLEEYDAEVEVTKELCEQIAKHVYSAVEAIVEDFLSELDLAD